MNNIEIIADDSSIELFADNGATVMTAIFFPSKTYSKLTISPEKDVNIKSVQLSALKSIWK